MWQLSLTTSRFIRIITFLFLLCTVTCTLLCIVHVHVLKVEKADDSKVILIPCYLLSQLNNICYNHQRNSLKEKEVQTNTVSSINVRNSMFNRDLQWFDFRQARMSLR